MRVLLLSDFYPPCIGGSERQTQALARELSTRGHEVVVATSRQRGDTPVSMDGTVTVYRLPALTSRIAYPAKSTRRRYPPPFPDPELVFRLRMLVRRFRPGVVHASGWIAYSAAAALLGATTPLLLSVRDYGYLCATRTYLLDGAICTGPSLAKCMRHSASSYGIAKGAAAYVSLRLGRRLLMRKTSILISVSSFVDYVMHDRATNRLWSSSTASGVVPDMVTSGSPALDAGGESSISYPEAPFILFVGALQEHKGLYPLLEAYSRMKTHVPLVLVGTEWPDSPSSFPEGVKVFRNVPHPDVLVGWQRCLFGVVPSVSPETFGNVILEAMEAGKPVVASRIGGIPDVVNDGETGLLVPPNDPDALANAMKSLVEDAELRHRLGTNARARADMYMPARVVVQFEAMYRSVASRALSSE